MFTRIYSSNIHSSLTDVPFGNGTVTRNLGLGTTLNFGTNGINGSLSGELSGANVLTYSAGQNMTGNLSFNDNLQYDLAKSKSLRAGEQAFEEARARQYQQREEFAQNNLSPEQYNEYANATPERQNEILKEAELSLNGNNQKSNTNFFTRALSDAKGYFASIAGFGYSDADSFTDSEGNFHERTCFVAGTLVVVEPNTIGAFEKGGTWFKKIEEIKIGDRVLSWNEKTGVTSYNRVIQLFVRETGLIYKLIFANGTSVETTWNHPFYINGKGFVETKDLKVGDLSHTASSVLLNISSISTDSRKETVYNFAVEENHTYYVTENSVLVHNQDDYYNKTYNDGWKYASDADTPNSLGEHTPIDGEDPEIITSYGTVDVGPAGPAGKGLSAIWNAIKSGEIKTALSVAGKGIVNFFTGGADDVAVVPILKGSYNEIYKNKLIDTYNFFKNEGFEFSEHALNKSLGNIANGRIRSRSNIVNTLQNGAQFTEANGNKVFYGNGLSIHQNPNGIIESVVPRNKPVSTWKPMK